MSSQRAPYTGLPPGILDVLRMALLDIQRYVRCGSFKVNNTESRFEKGHHFFLNSSELPWLFYY